MRNNAKNKSTHKFSHFRVCGISQAVYILRTHNKKGKKVANLRAKKNKKTGNKNIESAILQKLQDLMAKKKVFVIK